MFQSSISVRFLPANNELFEESCVFVCFSVLASGLKNSTICLSELNYCFIFNTVFTFGHPLNSGCCSKQFSKDLKLQTLSDQLLSWCLAGSTHKLCFPISWTLWKQQMISGAHPSIPNCRGSVTITNLSCLAFLDKVKDIYFHCNIQLRYLSLPPHQERQRFFLSMHALINTCIHNVYLSVCPSIPLKSQSTFGNSQK